jgi:hypothetical protein
MDVVFGHLAASLSVSLNYAWAGLLVVRRCQDMLTVVDRSTSRASPAPQSSAKMVSISRRPSSTLTISGTSSMTCGRAAIERIPARNSSRARPPSGYSSNTRQVLPIRRATLSAVWRPATSAY